MSHIRPPCRSHAPGRSRRSRGAVALMALVFTACGVLIMMAMLEYGAVVIKRQQVNQTADAVAAAWALQAASLPMDSWTTPYFSIDNTRAANMANGSPQSNTFGPVAFDAGNARSISPLFIDAWLPVFARVQSSMPFVDSSVIGKIVTGNGQFTLGAKLPTLSASSQMRISQVQLGRYVLQPERVVLLLDFSKTMLLNYTGTGMGSGVQAITVLQKAAETIIDHYGQLINLGVLMFSDGTVQTSRNPLSDNGKGVKSSDSANNQSTILNLVRAQPAIGDGTDLAGAIAFGSTMLSGALAQNLQSDASQSQARLILITDGEPDKIGGSATSTAGSRDDEIAQNRQLTQRAMANVWDTNNVALGGATTDVMFIQRKGEDGDKIDGVATKDFLATLAGSRGNGGDLKNFLQDGGDPAAIDTFINNQLTLQPRCRLSVLDDVTGLISYPATARYVLPQRDASGQMEPLYAFFVPDIKKPTQELRMQVYMDDLIGFNRAQATAGAVTDASGNVAAGYFQQASHSGALILYYDSKNHYAMVGGMLCAALASPTNTDFHMRIRLRWGNPRPVLPTCVASSDTANCNY